MSTVLEHAPIAPSKQKRPFVLKGVMQAPVTPLHADFSVDYDGLAKMVDEDHVGAGFLGVPREIQRVLFGQAAYEERARASPRSSPGLRRRACRRAT